MIEPRLWAIVLGGALATPLPLLIGRKKAIRSLRILIHFVSLLCFGLAGWLLSRDGNLWLGLLWFGFGFAWVGFFWIASIHRSLARSSHWHLGAVDSDEHQEQVEDRTEARGGLERTGRGILRRLVAMRELKVGRIVTPRERIVAADCAGGIAEAIDRMRGTRYMRIPMMDGSLDRIVGIVHAKDLIPLALEGGQPRPLKSVMRRPIFVSQDLTVSHVLELFRSQRGHLAIVVDEYGNTLGLVTREDVFRHLSDGVTEG